MINTKNIKYILHQHYMSILNHDVIVHIVSFCDIKEIHHMLSTNQQHYNSIKSYFIKKIQAKKLYILCYFPDVIIDIMNGISTFVFLPILEYQEHFEGSTGYIDQIKVSDVSYPIMIGVTKCARPFITFKLQNTVIGFTETFVETLFQRYTNDKYAWTFGTFYQSVLYNYNGYTTNLYNDQIQINDHLLKENIQLLLQNENYIHKSSIQILDNYAEIMKKMKVRLCYG